MQILLLTSILITHWGASKLLHSRILKYWQGITPTPSREIQLGCSLRRGESVNADRRFYGDNSSRYFTSQISRFGEACTFRGTSDVKCIRSMCVGVRH